MVWRTRLGLEIVGYVGLAIAIFVPAITGPFDTVSRMLARTDEGYAYFIVWVVIMLFLLHGLIPDIHPWARIILYLTGLSALLMACFRARGDTLVYHQWLALVTFALGVVALLGLNGSKLAVGIAVLCAVLMYTSSKFFEYPLIAALIYAVSTLDPPRGRKVETLKPPLAR